MQYITEEDAPTEYGETEQPRNSSLESSSMWIQVKLNYK